MFAAWSDGERALALEISRDLLREFPDFNFGLVLQGTIVYELARYDEAEQVLHNAIHGLPLDHLKYGYVHLGHLYKERGDYENAEKWYRKALELDPENAGRHVLLGALLAKRGDLRGAEAAHRTAARCPTGTRDEAYFNLGLVLRAQERYEEALDCFRRALELTPEYPDAATAARDIEKAIEYLHVDA